MRKVNMADSHETKVNKLSSKSKHKNNLKMKGLFNACFSFCLFCLVLGQYSQSWVCLKSQPTCCELSLHLLENRVLGCSLSPTGQRLRGSAGEHGGNIGDVLQADTKGANQLLDKVQCVRRDLGVRHCTALLKGHRVAFSQALLELPQDLQREEEGKVTAILIIKDDSTFFSNPNHFILKYA